MPLFIHLHIHLTYFSFHALQPSTCIYPNPGLIKPQPTSQPHNLFPVLFKLVSLLQYLFWIYTSFPRSLIYLLFQLPNLLLFNISTLHVSQAPLHSIAVSLLSPSITLSESPPHLTHTRLSLHCNLLSCFSLYLYPLTLITYSLVYHIVPT